MSALIEWLSVAWLALVCAVKGHVAVHEFTTDDAGYEHCIRCSVLLSEWGQ